MSSAPVQFDRPTPPARRTRRRAPLRIGVGATDDALAVAKRRGVELPESYYGTRSAQARAMSFSVSGLASLSQLQSVKDSMDGAFKAGESFTAWRKRVLRGEVPLSLPDYRLETIFRTNMQTVYMSGRGAQAVAHERTHPFLLYTATQDTRTRPAHADMHGTLLPIRDPWWNTHRPPNGYNCRCSVIAVTAAEAQRRGISPMAPAVPVDPGFDFDPWSNAMAGVNSAVDKFRKTATPKLAAKAAQLAVAAKAMRPDVRNLAEALAHGKAQVREIVGQLAAAAGRDEIGAGMLSGAVAFRKALAERIERVHGAPVKAAVSKSLGRKAAAAQVAEAGAAYPATWTNATNAFGSLTVHQSTARAFQFTLPKVLPDGAAVPVRDYRVNLGRRMTMEGTPGDGFIATYGDNLRVAVHEYGHRLQSALPELDRIFHDYHARRTAGEIAERLSKLVPGSSYKAAEVAKPDKFLNPYFGKIYDEHYYRGPLEMLPMTYERLLGPDSAGLLDLYRRDPELFELAVGLLTGWMP